MQMYGFITEAYSNKCISSPSEYNITYIVVLIYPLRVCVCVCVCVFQSVSGQGVIACVMGERESARAGMIRMQYGRHTYAMPVRRQRASSNGMRCASSPHLLHTLLHTLYLIEGSGRHEIRFQPSLAYQRGIHPAFSKVSQLVNLLHKATTYKERLSRMR
jgi:hypothetical protein